MSCSCRILEKYSCNVSWHRDMFSIPFFAYCLSNNATSLATKSSLDALYYSLFATMLKIKQTRFSVSLFSSFFHHHFCSFLSFSLALCLYGINKSYVCKGNWIKYWSEWVHRMKEKILMETWACFVCLWKRGFFFGGAMEKQKEFGFLDEILIKISFEMKWNWRRNEW